ncbi:transmembrane protein 79 [Pleurodeles waltl]|uniref:transmembrane protein 79 n=1 Tax=Pleurodeles waltl TaxID=8319 RepID=UPI0037095F90
MASTVAAQHADDCESPKDGEGNSPFFSHKVSFTDHDQEVDEECSFDHNDSTLQWEKTMNNSLSDDVKLAKIVPEGEKELPELERRLSADEGLGTLSSNKEDLPDGVQAEIAKGQEDEDENSMPDLASQVFVTSVQVVSGRHSMAQDHDRASLSSIQKKKGLFGAYEMRPIDPEKQPFLCQSPTSDPPYSMHPCRAGSDFSLADESIPSPRCCGCQNCTRSSLKAVASFVAALVIFPCFLYGAYVFLPFDVPLMPDVGMRLVYTLRCGVFATFPIIIGLVVYGISRICAASFDPFGKREREVEVHRRYATQSVHLFVLYFFNLAVLATYLPQELMKLVPLLTGLFALARLTYWLAFAMGRSFRGFGYGLTFLPMVAMLLANLYYMFILDPQNMFAMGNSGSPEAETPAPSSKLRMWG